MRLKGGIDDTNTVIEAQDVVAVVYRNREISILTSDLSYQHYVANKYTFKLST